MKEEPSVAIKITEVLVVAVWFVASCQRFRQRHRFRRPTADTDMIKMNGVVQFIFNRDDDDCISGHFFINCNIYAKKETYNNRAYQNYQDYFIYLPHSMRFQIKVDFSLRYCLVMLFVQFFGEKVKSSESLIVPNPDKPELTIDY
jgi:hypothetical protein